MKPFNLEAALKGARVVTRDGREVTSIGHMPTAKERQQVVYVVDESVWACGLDGVRPSGITRWDLFMAPTKKTYWVNVYKSGSGIPYTGSSHPSEEEARILKDKHRYYVTTISFEVEE
jgi:hypothetical protein